MTNCQIQSFEHSFFVTTVNPYCLVAFHENDPKSKTACSVSSEKQKPDLRPSSVVEPATRKEKSWAERNKNIYSANELCEVRTLHRPIYLKWEQAEWQMESARAFMRRMKIKLAIMLCRRRCNEGWTQRCRWKQWRAVKLLGSCSTKGTKL